ncbi:MAG: SDR family NAD(P)-dependent oxidoreductase, partial [Deltaproteobacteria bacterium]|nr:SDR family NAD(P)-dependent oxidoreductase [Deltaproteobacteria bacterium]
MRLENKRVIITGAGTGIGRAIAERFCREGAKVMVAEIEELGGKQTVERILKSGGTAVFQQTDTSLEDSIQSMVERTVSEFGGIDIVVNNAAAFVFGSIEET